MKELLVISGSEDMQISGNVTLHLTKTGTPESGFLAGNLVSFKRSELTTEEGQELVRRKEFREFLCDYVQKNPQFGQSKRLD